jgi:hypothetical protein
MEPLKPVMRDALKREYPDLSDEVIDRAEELLAQRFMVDPEAEPLRIEEIDRQRAQLLSENMPRFEQVIQRVRGQERADQNLD